MRRRFELFQRLLRADRSCLKLITMLEEMEQRPIPADWSRVTLLVEALATALARLVDCLQKMRPEVYDQLTGSHARILAQLRHLLPSPEGDAAPPFTLLLEEAWAHPELLGGKAATLARIAHETRIPVQPGLVVTTSAFHAFLEENGLRPAIARQLRSLSLGRPQHLTRVAAVLREMIMAGRVPEQIRVAIGEAIDRITRQSPVATWAVRSSAMAEDGEISFAGQYASVLKVAPRDIFTAYKTVLASKYSPRALTYRLHSGLEDGQTAMAVLLLPMLDPRVSGVMYTLDPLDLCRGACLVITAVPGLGSRLVDGSTVPDILLVSRQDPQQFLARQPAPGSNGGGNTAARGAESDRLCLADDSATTLAKWGLELEALLGTPQDVEWAQDQAGGLIVLQSRAIGGSRSAAGQTLPGEEHPATPPPAKHIGVLLEVGTPASVGIAAGPVYRISGEAELDQVPVGAVLVTPGIPPALVQLAQKVQAVLAEHGSKASHFASVAREFGLPVVVGLGGLVNTLTPGRTVTVDAYRGVVYEGEVEELLRWQERQQTRPPSPFQRRLAPIMELISPLNLTDPQGADFVPANCRSFHDLVRFVHEMGTREMFALAEEGGNRWRRAKTLETDIPIVMQVLDLGDGLAAAAKAARSVTPEQLQSAPMRAVWAGLTDGEINWAKGLLHLDWERFDQLSGGIFSLKSSQLASYALVARNYAHLLLRFGYHLAVVDALSGRRPEENHIQFRFKGGGGSPEKKGWRLAMIARVLLHFGFQVQVRGDMLEAKCMRRDQQATQLRLRILGYLLGRTPLLDMALQNQDDALRMADQLVKKWTTP
ncbi:PEP/pyruvate-binding domain-containing protein [Desulfurivibrio sp. D14AmB]|uniref:PEP/pyruvate-binding domain-containing protein n=1 Tax=Desulfurivibrio sp. D14AmB TaxID=3374370 RepID=UPI00376F458F